MIAPIVPGWRGIAVWGSHPLENTTFAWRTPNSDVERLHLNDRNADLDIRGKRQRNSQWV